MAGGIMTEENKGGIEAGASSEDIVQDIDPELVDDRETQDDVAVVFDLPDYEPALFEFPDDEYDPEVDE
jgi:hypothetical protein